MYLETVIVNEIVNTIFSINVSKAVGHDKIPAYFLKIAPLKLTPFLLILINYDFTNGFFEVTVKFLK